LNFYCCTVCGYFVHNIINITGIVAHSQDGIRPFAGGLFAQSALHFAAGEVLDSMYGFETGNEIFLTYPSQLIENEYHPDDEVDKGRQNDDVWVWTKENAGIPIDAGLIFLPENTQVSPESGSKYELDSGFKPQIIEENVEAIRNLVGEDAILNEILEHKGDNTTLKEKLIVGYGLSEELSEMLMNGNLKPLYGLRFKGKPEAWTLEEVKEKSTRDIVTLLATNQLLFRKPEHTVRAKDYWEQYFDAHPEQKPKHVTYYNGDPTQAIKDWQIANGIRKIASINEPDFSDKVVRRGSPEAMDGSEEFIQLMLSMIDERFPEQEALAS